MKKSVFFVAALLSTALSSFAANQSMTSSKSVKAITEVASSNETFQGITSDELRQYSNKMICAAYNRYFVDHLFAENYREVRNNITNLERAIGKDDLHSMLEIMNACMDDNDLRADFVAENAK